MHKKALLIAVIFIILSAGCSSPAANPQKKDSLTSKTAAVPSTKSTVAPVSDVDQIRTLIRTVLVWGFDKPNIDLLPLTIKDSICTGFDMAKVNEAAKNLKATGFFADEFIDNYKHIIQTLDKKIKNKAYGNWNGEEIPPFAFASDSNPWCSCQDYMDWNGVDVVVVKLESTKGDMKWNWGKLPPGTDPSWKEASTHFRVVKAAGKWKISYLDGFDYKQSTGTN